MNSDLGNICFLHLITAPKLKGVSLFCRSSNHISPEDCSLVFCSIWSTSAREILNKDLKLLIASQFAIDSSGVVEGNLSNILSQTLESFILRCIDSECRFFDGISRCMVSKGHG